MIELEIFSVALFICLARATDVSMATVRMILTFRGKKIQAALIGFFEVIIYVSALGVIVQNLDNPINLIAYGLGFAGGILLGSKIEEKLALGYVTVQVTVNDYNEKLSDLLRKEGYGVTIFDAQGLEGPKKVLNIFALRKNLNDILSLIQNSGFACFITVMDARTTLGGYIKMAKKK